MPPSSRDADAHFANAPFGEGRRYPLRVGLADEHNRSRICSHVALPIRRP